MAVPSRFPATDGVSNVLLEVTDTLRQPPSALHQIRRSINVALAVAAAFYISVACTVRMRTSTLLGSCSSRSSAPKAIMPDVPQPPPRPHPPQGYASLGNATPSLVLSGFTGG